jgi:2-oxo-3-hexenedioate decarboxylase
LKRPVAGDADALAVLACTEWIAPGFEIVQSHFPDWKFAAADCTAAFGLHGALLIGAPIPVTERNRGFLAETLARFTLTLRQGADVIDEGVGANVLDSPALALAHLARVLAGQPQFSSARRGGNRHDRHDHRRVAGAEGRDVDFGLRDA